MPQTETVAALRRPPLTPGARHPEPARAPAGRTNVAEPERWASVAGGAALALYGLSRGSGTGALLALLGGGLLYRGATGHCPMYQTLGVNTAARGPERARTADRGIRVHRSMTINRSPEELYRFCRRLENLPRFMSHLDSVEMVDERRFHWNTRNFLGKPTTWEAEIAEDRPNEVIAWRSLEGTEMNSAGSVSLRRAPGGRGTVVTVALRYDPPGGALTASLARLFGQHPEQEMQEDLRRLKQMLEAGEVPRTEGQPKGRCGW